MNNHIETKFRDYATMLMSSNSVCDSTFLRRFKTHFGVSPAICAIIWNKIKDNLPSNSFYEIHLLWTLYFLKTYNTEHLNHSFAKADEKTFRNKVWKIIEELARIQEVFY